jgi:hypothetical protein
LRYISSSKNAKTKPAITVLRSEERIPAITASLFRICP